MLVELSLAIVLLLFLSLWVFRTNVQTVSPRNWAMVQSITDAYMTGPLAQAESIDFNTLVDAGSPWPTYPNSTSTNVLVGTLPLDSDNDGAADVDGLGNLIGRDISGTLVQTKQPAANNLASAGGTGTTLTNPARVESWLVQSHLTYTVGGRTYVKSRTTIRTR